MLEVKTIDFFEEFTWIEVNIPEERDAFVLDHQHGRRDVMCTPAIQRLWAPDPGYQYFFFMCGGMFSFGRTMTVLRTKLWAAKWIAIKTWPKPETTHEKSLAPMVEVTMWLRTLISGILASKCRRQLSWVLCTWKWWSKLMTRSTSAFAGNLLLGWREAMSGNTSGLAGYR